MSKNGRSERNMFGGYTHYDGKGHKTGSSSPNLFGGYTNYDEKGHRTGSSSRNMLGGYNHYDNKGHKTGSSSPSVFGSYTNYDAKGHKTGSSDPNLTGGYNHYNSTGGCYVATCVYGSYDCPEVWVLRRFRDEQLAKSFWGRIFIKIYYAISPTIVKWFGSTGWFKRFWRNRLDKMVSCLRKNGLSDAPYNDHQW